MFMSAAIISSSSSSKAAILFLCFLYKITLKFPYRIMGRLIILFAVYSFLEFYKKAAFKAFVGIFYMDFTKCGDFGCGFFVLSCFSKVFNGLVLFFVFLVGFKLVQFGGCCKFRKGFSCSNDGDNDVFDDGLKKKKQSFKKGTTKMSRGLSGDQEFDNDGDDGVGDESEGSEEESEDQVFDVMALRKMVKVERRKANVAQLELEKERMAAASAADEAMAMILRLQGEKSSLQIHASQLERLAEEKEGYDQGVIQSLQWIIMKHESERSLLEDRLRMCREKLRLYVKNEEWDQFDSLCPTPSVSPFAGFDEGMFDDCAG